MRAYSGIVQKGARRGAALGFPTANISLTDASISGIYAARVAINGQDYPATVFADPERRILEAYLLDFSGDLYGKEIEVTLEKKIRENKVFDNDESLRAAIADDIEKVREYFKNR